MARIIIEQPVQHAFTTELDIYLTHINEAGHVDNALMLTLVSEARQRFFRSMGYRQTDVEGVGIVVADASVQYLSEAFHGETMVVEMSALDFNRYGCDLVWRIRERESGRDVAKGKTGIVFFDYAARKIAPVPPAFRERTEQAL
jgi:4-hydroxybenzoyl-CoA thioesterase